MKKKTTAKPSGKVRYGLANKRATALVERFGYSQPPVNVEEVATRLGLKVVREDLPEDVSGLLLTSPDSDAICINRHTSRNRQRFTIAHEIGHYHLGHPFQPGEHVHVEKDVYISQRGRKASEGVDPKEIEANEFAACLLMPKAMIDEALESPVTDEGITALAKRFGVSEQAMTLRLTRLDHL